MTYAGRILPGMWFRLPYAGDPLIQALRESGIPGQWVVRDRDGRTQPGYTLLASCTHVKAPPDPPLRKRVPSRKMAEDWPFRESVIPGRGLVRNVRVTVRRKNSELVRRPLTRR